MNKKWIALVGTGILITGLSVAGSSFAKSAGTATPSGTIQVGNHAESDFPALAKITMDQAVQKALATVQGQVLKTELEDENGFLVYGVEVVTADKSIVDVKVDAGSGTVLAQEQDKFDESEGHHGRDESEREHGGDRDREE